MAQYKSQYWTSSSGSIFRLIRTPLALEWVSESVSQVEWVSEWVSESVSQSEEESVSQSVSQKGSEWVF